MGRLIRLWPVITTIVIVSIAYGVMTNRIDNDEKKIDGHVGSDEKITQEYGQRLARVEKAVESIPEIQKDVKEILRRVR